MKCNTIEPPADPWEGCEVVGEECEDEYIEIRGCIEIKEVRPSEPTINEIRPEYEPQADNLVEELERQK